MIKNARKEIDREKRQEAEQKKKMALQKVQQDVMLLEAQGKKIREF